MLTKDSKVPRNVLISMLLVVLSIFGEKQCRSTFLGSSIFPHLHQILHTDYLRDYDYGINRPNGNSQ